MEKKNAKELVSVLQACIDGNKIERKLKGEENAIWRECNLQDLDEYSFSDYEFRVKPKPTCCPFNNEVACIDEMGKHFPNGYVFSKSKHQYCNIDKVHSKGIDVGNESYTFFNAMVKFRFADGTPFGQIEEVIS